MNVLWEATMLRNRCVRTIHSMRVYAMLLGSDVTWLAMVGAFQDWGREKGDGGRRTRAAGA
jgi:hypothetical protein